MEGSQRVERVAVAILLSALAAACSPDSTGGSAAAACNALIDDGPRVAFMTSGATAPTPTGGTIADGTYELTALTIYGTGTAPNGMFSVVSQVTGNTMQQVGHENDVERRYTTTFTISGTTISTQDSCPAPDSGEHSLSATATEFRIYDTTPAGILEQTNTKR